MDSSKHAKVLAEWEKIRDRRLDSVPWNPADDQQLGWPTPTKPFPCTSCGECCKAEFVAPHGMPTKDGYCHNYDRETRLCRIYEERPSFCRVPRNRYRQVAMQCNSLQEQAGLPTVFRIRPQDIK